MPGWARHPDRRPRWPRATSAPSSGMAQRRRGGEGVQLLSPGASLGDGCEAIVLTSWSGAFSPGCVRGSSPGGKRDVVQERGQAWAPCACWRQAPMSAVQQSERMRKAAQGALRVAASESETASVRSRGSWAGLARHTTYREPQSSMSHPGAERCRERPGLADVRHRGAEGRWPSGKSKAVVASSGVTSVSRRETHSRARSGVGAGPSLWPSASAAFCMRVR